MAGDEPGENALLMLRNLVKLSSCSGQFEQWAIREAQLILSPLWLRYFRFGGRPPMRRIDAGATAG